MLSYLNNRATRLKWIGQAPEENKKTAILIPQYNEFSAGNFARRLAHFTKFAASCHDEVDVILVDDGSTDDSLPMLEQWMAENPGCFYLASITPNANKVGALFMVVLTVRHEFIVLSDFDTDLHHLGQLDRALCQLKQDAKLMGCYFRMLPHEGTGGVFLFQQLEYCLQRSIYRFHREERSIRVMPGAASCYKRNVLASIYHQHSGLRSGEDREATLIGLRLGYKTFYQDEILALTRPPLTFKALVKQRIRWNLGYLETFAKEKAYYYKEMAGLTRVGVVTVSDILIVLFMAILPVLVIGFAFIDPRALLVFLVVVYGCYVLWCLNCLYHSPTESREFKGKLIASVAIFPFFKIAVDYLSWMGAIGRMFKKKPVRAKRNQEVHYGELLHHRIRYENTTHHPSDLEDGVDPGGVREDVPVLEKKTS